MLDVYLEADVAHCGPITGTFLSDGTQTAGGRGAVIGRAADHRFLVRKSCLLSSSAATVSCDSLPNLSHVGVGSCWAL